MDTETAFQQLAARVKVLEGLVGQGPTPPPSNAVTVEEITALQAEVDSTIAAAGGQPAPTPTPTPTPAPSNQSQAIPVGQLAGQVTQSGNLPNVGDASQTGISQSQNPPTPPTDTNLSNIPGMGVMQSIPFANPAPVQTQTQQANAAGTRTPL
jgi:hypothetical protein